MNEKPEKRRASGLVDYFALTLTTFGVGYIPGAPGTYGSIIGVAIYLGSWQVISRLSDRITAHDPKFWAYNAAVYAAIAVLITALGLIGIWASNRTIPIFGTEDPHQAVVDEVIGQIITFLFIPFTTYWPLIFAGFVLFRLFDIWKPYPIDALQALPGGLGICADDIVAGVYAGVCLTIFNAIILAI
jgi:phosphatidylglycerophosphatase A